MTAPTAASVGNGGLPTLRGVPRLRLRHDNERHREWPHVVKFSGGRSSALMLMGLLYGRQLKPSRGDVIVFNNTSAEHPATYRFAAACKRIAEERFNIPFFWTEFQTYEDAKRGQWSRSASYRLVTSAPHSGCHPEGYRSNGEVFEELVSWKQALPTRFARTCTEFLKLHTTVRFLEDWFGRPSTLAARGTAATRRLGHWYGRPRLNPSTYGERSSIVRYHLARRIDRPAQVFQEFTDARLTRLTNPTAVARTFDSKAQVRGDDPVEFISLVGLRADEPRRVARVLGRNNGIDNEGRLADGERVLAPLHDEGISKRDVLDFWEAQNWDLGTPADANLSNCVFCFMKGELALRQLAHAAEGGGGAAAQGPDAVGWWADIERRYARAVPSRSRPDAVTRFGFFGANRLGYERIIHASAQNDGAPALGALPCDCTD